MTSDNLLAHAHEARVASARLLPPLTLLQLARESASSADMPWLLALEEVGAFTFKEVQTIQAEPRLNPNARLMIETLAEPLFASTQAEKNRRQVSYTFDVYSGDPIDQGMLLHSVAVGNPYFEFFRRRVGEFAAHTSALLKEDLFASLSSAVATAGVLMGMAAALNDASSIKVLGAVFPTARDTLLSGVLPTTLTPAARPTTNTITVCTPAALAVAYGAREALDALRELGWKPSDRVIERNRTEADGSLLDLDKFNTLEWLVNMGQRGQIFTFPSVIERIIEYSQQEVAANPDTSLADSMWQDMVSFVHLTLNSGQKLSAFLPALRRSGALDLTANDFAVSAAKKLNLFALDLLRVKIDWQQWGGPLRHTQVMSRLIDLPLLAENFPPVAMALKLSSDPFQIPDSDGEVSKLCQACIDAGHGHLLAVSEGPHTPVRVMASLGFTRSMLLCLEQGADPTRPGPGTTGPLLSAVDLAEQHESADRVMRSFLARKAMLRASAELTLSQKILGATL